MAEIDRLIKVYQSYRENQTFKVLWDERNPGNQAILKERREKAQEILEQHGFLPLNERRVLDVGCGSGKVLASLIELGARPDNLYGIDLLPDRIEEAKTNYPNLHFQFANAEHLNFPDGSFDLILIFTVFSSILDDSMARNVAAEVYRLLKPGGAALWYDFRYNNPRNLNVRGVTKDRIKTLFPKLSIHLHTITLLPLLARRLGMLTPILYPALSAVPILRTHYLGLFIKPS